MCVSSFDKNMRFFLKKNCKRFVKVFVKDMPEFTIFPHGVLKTLVSIGTEKSIVGEKGSNGSFETELGRIFSNSKESG